MAGSASRRAYDPPALYTLGPVGDVTLGGGQITTATPTRSGGVDTVTLALVQATATSPSRSYSRRRAQRQSVNTGRRGPWTAIGRPPDLDTIRLVCRSRRWFGDGGGSNT